MTSARRPLRAIHTADVHLGSDGYGSPEEQRAHDARGRRALSGIVDLALRDAVDVVLIAGDLFDHNRVPDELVAFVEADDSRSRCRRRIAAMTFHANNPPIAKPMIPPGTKSPPGMPANQIVGCPSSGGSSSIAP